MNKVLATLSSAWDNSKQTILIWSPGFNAGSGGVVILHKLCQILRKKGANAYMWTDDSNDCPLFDAPNAKGKINPANCITIYPEIVGNENPLNTKYVVRWLLYVSGMTYNPNEIFVTHSKRFTEFGNFPICPELKVIEPFYQHFHPSITPINRKGGCFIVKKGAGKRIWPLCDDLVR